MKSVQIQLTSKCNQRCYMCRKYTWPQKEIPLDILREKIEKYKDCTFTFSGGDPLSYSNIKGLVEILKQYDISYQIFTNLDYDLTGDMKELIKGAEFVQVSLDGNSEATYYSVRRPIVHDYNRVVRNLRTIDRSRLKINVTVSKRNYFDVIDIAHLYGLMYEIKVRFFPVHTDEGAMLEPYMVEHIKDKFDEFCHRYVNSSKLKFIFKFTNLIEFCETALQKRPLPEKCFVKKHHRVIDEDGVEYTCCRAINDNGADWNKEYRIEEMPSLDDENVFYPYCTGCDRYIKFNESPACFNSEKIYL